MAKSSYHARFRHDIVCLQETKLTRKELTRDLAVVDGWESFFTFSNSKTGYSGVATFCKNSTSLPFEAFLKLSDFLQSYDLVEEQSELTIEDLCELDDEGRCLITVHGDFILFNIYAPALVADIDLRNRMQLKVKWFGMLENCVRCLTQRQFNILIVGDLNCAPHLIDHCNPSPPQEFYSRPDRQILTRMLNTNGGLCYDVFRKIHPNKSEAYSCWNQVTSARVNNYGTRIDLILAAENSNSPSSFISSFVDARIMIEQEGSDHAAVWVKRTLADKPSLPESIPRGSARFFFTGKQTTIDSYFLKENGDHRRDEDLDLQKQPVRKKRKKSRQATLKAFFESSPKQEMELDVELDLPPKSRGLSGEWKTFFDKRKPPLCNEHHEPCVVREVKKDGANKGRRFYVCGRPEGPKPIGRCNYFKWADKVKRHH